VSSNPVYPLPIREKKGYLLGTHPRLKIKRRAINTKE
jgi:hypothetical protein